jgi:hypothetical protein
LLGDSAGKKHGEHKAEHHQYFDNKDLYSEEARKNPSDIYRERRCPEEDVSIKNISVANAMNNLQKPTFVSHIKTARDTNKKARGEEYGPIEKQ